MADGYMPQPDSGDNCCDCPDRTSPCDDCGGGTGACCNIGAATCVDGSNYDDCTTSGGVYLGDDSTCAEDGGNNCQCCPFFDHYNTIHFSGQILGCPNGTITLPAQTWTKVPGLLVNCDALSPGQFNADSLICSCLFSAVNCPPPFGSAEQFITLDSRGSINGGCAHFDEFNNIFAAIDCSGQVSFAGSTGTDSVSSDQCPTVSTLNFGDVGPYDLSGGPIDVTVAATGGPGAGTIHFRCVLSVTP